MKLELVVPEVRDVALDGLIEALSAPPALSPFDARTLDFAARFSQRLLRDAEAKSFPELVALGYWMRPSALARLREEFETAGAANRLRVPRGFVFHVPPSNVDTIFVYSWMLATLAGNRNLVRLSQRSGPQAGVLCRLLNDALNEAAEEVRASTAMVRYGRDESINAAISRACDVRVVWGGDATVERMRAYLLAPHAKELTFPNRYSFAAIKASAFLALDDAQRCRAVESFFNDTFWFDQMACSSPRALFWVGADSECSEALERFAQALASHPKARAHVEQPATHMAKYTDACRALLDGTAVSYREYGPLGVLGTEGNVPEVETGGGFIWTKRMERLDDLIPWVKRKHQTLSHLGFGEDELRCFARKLNGRGIDRMVPIGQALSFNRVWDGYDLMEELVRHVAIETA